MILEKGLRIISNDYLGERILQALEVMAHNGNNEALWSIVTSIDSHWGACAMQVLKDLGDKAAENLIESLQGSNDLMKRQAVIALGEIGSKKATKPLAAILAKYGEEDYELLEEVVRAIGKIKDPKSVETLPHAIKSEPLHDDKDYRIQNLVIFALGDIGDSRDCEPLANLLIKAQESRIRWTAAHALAKIGAAITDDKVIDLLVTVLENKREDTALRQLAAWALLQVDQDKVALPLVNYLKNNALANLKHILFEESEVKA